MPVWSVSSVQSHAAGGRPELSLLQHLRQVVAGCSCGLISVNKRAVVSPDLDLELVADVEEAVPSSSMLLWGQRGAGQGKQGIDVLLHSAQIGRAHV